MASLDFEKGGESGWLGDWRNKKKKTLSPTGLTHHLPSRCFTVKKQPTRRTRSSSRRPPSPFVIVHHLCVCVCVYDFSFLFPTMLYHLLFFYPYILPGRKWKKATEFFLNFHLKTKYEKFRSCPGKIGCVKGLFIYFFLVNDTSDLVSFTWKDLQQQTTWLALLFF